eukprot:6649792-Pyramimonas_sp.AAC.1
MALRFPFSYLIISQTFANHAGTSQGSAGRMRPSAHMPSVRHRHIGSTPRLRPHHTYINIKSPHRKKLRGSRGGLEGV